jgi:hypothetical protein
MKIFSDKDDNMKTNNNGMVLSKIRNKVLERINEVPPEALIVRGIWHIEYVINLSPERGSPILHLGYVVVQTIEQGCSYYEIPQEDPGINEKLLGKNIIEFDSTINLCYYIAGLDAVYHYLCGNPYKKYKLKGSNFEKAKERAQIVVDEAMKTLSNSTPKNGKKFVIVNIGVVGQFLALLSKRTDTVVYASDFYGGVVGREFFGVRVSHGSQTEKLVAEADLAIVTGMTLANNTIELKSIILG